MSPHDMIPSTVEGFHTQCRNCGALDTELRFNLSEECPNAPKELAAAFYQENAIDLARNRLLSVHPSQTQLAAIYQAAWFQGFIRRQFEAAMEKEE
jgi:hypothetical protein